MRPSIEIAKKHFEHKEIADYNSVIGVEIGVCYGINAFDMLKNFPKLGMLHLVDPYIGRMPHYYAGARKLLSPYEHRIVWHIVNSEYAVRRFTKETLDFVYIDGSHTITDVIKDCELWYPKVRGDAGMLCGHDYNPEKNDRLSIEVKLAVNKFTKNNNLTLYSDDSDWWIFKE